MQREREKLRKEEERKSKAATREKQREDQDRVKRGRHVKARDKENCHIEKPSTSNSGPKQYPTRKAMKTNDHTDPKVASDMCVVCMGAYIDDVDDNGEVTADWIQCADSTCGVWSHIDCLDRHANDYVCAICFNVFN